MLRRPIDNHLDRRELEALVIREESGAADAIDPTISDAVLHLTSCPDCREQLEMLKYLRGNGGANNSSTERVATPECVDEEQWTRVAAGIVPIEEARGLIRHAANCARCGPLLRTSIETMADESSAEENALMATLESSGTRWQADMSRRLSGSTHVSKPPRQAERQKAFHVPMWLIPAFGVMALFAVASWVGLHLSHKATVNQLLAEAYTNRRTIETRFPGASYAPLRVERGSGASEIDKPQALLQAEALLSKSLASRPNDPSLLQAKARADMLDGNFDAAIQSLNRALEQDPESPALSADLGSAFYLRGRVADSPLDYGKALDSLAKALNERPDDAVVLFNHALACERLFLFTEAKDDWVRYLQLDPKGGWADEAQSHLQAVEEQIRRQQSNENQPLLTPREIASLTSPSAAMRDPIDLRIEQYMHAALVEWLPAAFSGAAPERDSKDAKLALFVVADVLRQDHKDPWLRDLLLNTSDKSFPSAIHDLSASIEADDRGDYAAAQKFAVRAARLFTRAQNSAGRMRAMAEAVYSDHLLWESKRCFADLETLRRPLAESSYGWLRGQMSLERSNCASLVGDLETYQTAIAEGVREAYSHGFVPLYLRGLGFEALSAASFGDDAKDFDLASQGLALFWSRPVDIMKGYNLYFDLDSAADALQLRNLQVALWREAIVLIDQHPDVLQRAMAHRWAGKAALSAGMPSLAATEFADASALFASSPHTVATERDFIDAEVWLANAELQRGDLESAEKRLAALKPALTAAPSFDPQLGYYSTEADVALQEGDRARIDIVLPSALAVAERALNSLDSDFLRREWAEQTRSIYSDAVRWKVRQGDPRAALEIWEWFRGAELRSRGKANIASLRESSNRAPLNDGTAPAIAIPSEVAHDLHAIQDHTVAVYAVFSDGIAFWTYDNRGIDFVWIPEPADKLKSLVDQLNRLCADPNSDLVALQSVARKLYDLLIAPLDSRLRSGRSIAFEPDDLLSSVPWEALIDPQGSYLAERAPIIVTPGLYQTRRLRPSLPINSQSPALIVAVPAVPKESLPALTDAEEEARVVANHFHEPRELFASAATLKAIRQHIAGAEIFHFAGHSIRSPQRTGLLLSEFDASSQHAQVISVGSLARRDVQELQLAVLSACSVTTSRDVDSPAGSLTTYLLSNGVPHVVSSRWSIDSRETATFMSNFYAQLFDGKSVPSAIRVARLALARRAVSRHPYYWAAFELQGAT